MGRYYIASKKVFVNVTCESCNNSFSFDKLVSYKSGLRDNAVKGLKDKIERYELGMRKCPKCGYIQSWMVSACLLRNAIIGIIIGVLITAGLLYNRKALPQFFHPGKLGIWLLILVPPIVFCFLFSILLKPNRKHSKKKDNEIKKLKPVLSFNYDDVEERIAIELEKACRFELHGKYDEALMIYDRLARNPHNTANHDYAVNCAKSLRDKIERQKEG